MTLHHGASDTAALDDGPRAMLLAVFLARAALKKHAASIAPEASEERGWVATTRTLGTPNAKNLRKIARSTRKKNQIAVQ